MSKNLKTSRDQIWLDEIVADIKRSPPNVGSFTHFELTTLDNVESELGNINQASWTGLDDDLFFPKEKVYKDGDQVGIGRCVGKIHTMPERALGYIFNVESDHRMTKHIKSNGPNAEQYPNIEIARINDYHQIFYTCRKLPFPLIARDWL